MPLSLSLARYPSLARMATEVLEVWPEHAPFLDRSLGGHGPAALEQLDELARQALLVAPDPRRLSTSYRWMCGEILTEELYFRRHKAYRCKSFAQAIAEVYDNRPFMRRYMEGVLVSQLFWHNHATAYLYFLSVFLPRLREGYDYLEIGPGHGLFLAQAARDGRNGTATGWDVSRESLRHTRQSLQKLSVGKSVRLARRDVLAGAGPRPVRFDAVVMSEVLEHLEEPARALETVKASLRPEGLLLVNVPVNSPAPDHIFLLRHPDEVADLLTGSGFEIVEFTSVPMTGYSLQRALKAGVAITCLAIARARA
jgi:2-polyprenyl-3-methyl-5-hydroxy-6-metoxy-1,4-benzoquinol methylase